MPSLPQSQSGNPPSIGAAEPAPAIQSIAELRERFCCPGVEFQEVSGLRVAVLKLAEGSSVRVLLEGARVIAWRAVMYHKGKEDLIYSKLNRQAHQHAAAFIPSRSDSRG